MIMNVPSTKVSQDHRSVLKHENMQDTLSNVYTNECTSLRGRGNKWLCNNRVKFSNNHTYQYYDMNESVLKGGITVEDLQNGWTLVQPRRQLRENKLAAMKTIRYNEKITFYIKSDLIIKITLLHTTIIFHATSWYF